MERNRDLLLHRMRQVSHGINAVGKLLESMCAICVFFFEGPTNDL